MNQTELKKILNKRAGKSKYGNHKVHCLSKHLHDSKLEANYCNRLLAMKQKGEIIGYTVQSKFDLIVQEVLICRHIVDFVVCKQDQDMVWVYESHDTKGIKTADWVIKKKLFEVLYPHIKYVVVTKH